MRSHLARLKAATEPVGIAPAEALALLVLLAGAASLTFVVWWGNRPVPLGDGRPTAGAEVAGIDIDPASRPPRAQGDPAADIRPGGADGAGAVPADAASDPTTSVVVHVAGQVASPGLVTLPGGSRVADAVEAAGGLTPTGSVLTTNLARVLVDGEQIVIPVLGEEPPVAAGSSSTGDGTAGSAEPAGPLDLNAATLADLEDLPGLGPVMAQRILDHRERIGGFADVAQLLEVPGIGPSRFAELEPRVRV